MQRILLLQMHIRPMKSKENEKSNLGNTGYHDSLLRPTVWLRFRNSCTFGPLKNMFHTKPSDKNAMILRQVLL